MKITTGNSVLTLIDDSDKSTSIQSSFIARIRNTGTKVYISADVLIIIYPEMVTEVNAVPGTFTASQIEAIITSLMDNRMSDEIADVVLAVSGWVLNEGLYEYDYANADIPENANVLVIPANADAAIVSAAEILPEVDVTAGHAVIYATNAPTDDIHVTLLLV